MALIFVTRKLPFEAVDRLDDAHELDVWPGALPPSPQELRTRIAEAEGLLCLLTEQIGATTIDAAPRLRAISVLAVGYDGVDVAAAHARGIAVGHTPGVLTESTADLTWALILAAARQIVPAAAAARDGSWTSWEPAGWLGLELSGATLGIIGFGRIGQAVARRASGFGMEVLHTGDRCTEDVLERSDVVSLHVPLNNKTRGMIDATALHRMKPGAILVNTARGPIVDQGALAAALHSGHLSAAALDVTDPEPPSKDDPLLRTPNLLLVPHIASATHKTRERMATIAVDNLLAALAGEPMPHPVPKP